MKIAQVAPLFESVPPKFYGGTERVVSYLTEELVRLGHNVTLFASGDSVTRARLQAMRNISIRLDKNCVDQMAHHILQLENVFRQAHKFDVVHFHIDYLHFPLSRMTKIPQFTTLHGRLDIPELVYMYDEYRDMPVVSISDSQRAPLPQARWIGTVHHGLPQDLYSFHPDHDDYFAFLGRISREKRVDRAILIAKKLGRKLKVAAKVEGIDKIYFKEEIEPLLDSALIEFVGEIGEGEKDEFLGNAAALLFPIDWPEPFGLVMIEAMACGTPVIAYRHGSVPEVIQHGVNGFIADDLQTAVEAAGRIGEIDRANCRRIFEERFSSEKMAKGYLEIYEKIRTGTLPASGRRRTTAITPIIPRERIGSAAHAKS